MNSFIIVGYFASWSIYCRRFTVNDINPTSYSHLILAFFGIDENNQIYSQDPKADFGVSSNIDKNETSNLNVGQNHTTASDEGANPEHHELTQLVDSSQQAGDIIQKSNSVLFDSVQEENVNSLPDNSIHNEKHSERKGNSVNNDILQGNLGDLFRLKQSNPSLKTGISIGGQCASKNFPLATSTFETRAVFIASVIQAIQNYGLDFVDLDWEFPNNMQEGVCFAKLVEEMHATFRKKCPYAKISVAIPVSEYFLQHYCLEKMVPFVEFFNMMTYSYGDYWCKNVKHLAPLFLPNDICVSSSVKLIKKLGVPAEKLVLGIPTYCVSYAGTTQLNSEYTGRVFGREGYLDINDLETLPDEVQVHLDYSIGAAYSICMEKNYIISHECKETLIQKMAFAESEDLGGMMFWHVAADCKKESSFAKIVADNWREHLDKTSNNQEYANSKYLNVKKLDEEKQ